MEFAQLLKGILEGCILKIISIKETYGYEIIIELNKNGFNDVMEGTLYPILLRLETKKYVVCRKEKSPIGPYRKYYRITEEGLKQLDNFEKNYVQIHKCVNKILFSKNKKEVGLNEN